MANRKGRKKTEIKPRIAVANRSLTKNGNGKCTPPFQLLWENFSTCVHTWPKKKLKMSSISTVLTQWLINSSWGNFIIMTKKLGLLNLFPSYLFYFHNQLSGWGCDANSFVRNSIAPLIAKHHSITPLMT